MLAACEPGSRGRALERLLGPFKPEHRSESEGQFDRVTEFCARRDVVVVLQQLRDIVQRVKDTSDSKAKAIHIVVGCGL